MISHNWDGDIFFGRAWCDQHGDGVITAAKKELKEHVEEMENQRDITGSEGWGYLWGHRPWWQLQPQGLLSASVGLSGEREESQWKPHQQFHKPLLQREEPVLEHKLQLIQSYKWMMYQFVYIFITGIMLLLLISFSFLSRWPTRHGTLVSHGSLYRQYTADNSFDFTKDKLAVLDTNSYSLYTVDMLRHKMAHRKLIEVPPAVSWSTKARDPLAFIFPVKVVIVRNFLPWVYVPFCKEHYLDEHRNNKLWEPCSLTYTPSGLRSKL